MIRRFIALAFLITVLSGGSYAHGDIYRTADQTSADPKADLAEEESAEREMAVGRFYVKKRDYTGAINRFKIVVTHYPNSVRVDEALGLLVETYLALGIPLEAQTAAAVLNRKYPNSGWSRVADELLKSAGLEPTEEENSWISHAFK